MREERKGRKGWRIKEKEKGRDRKREMGTAQEGKGEECH